jgi:hypothetical protein
MPGVLQGSCYVKVPWDGTTFGDEMELGELTRLGDEGDA